MTGSQIPWFTSRMHPRYPAPQAERIWSDHARAKRMRTVSDAYTREALHRGLLGPEDPAWAQRAVKALEVAGPVSVAEWKGAEAYSGHEIVGFLSAYLSRLPEDVWPYVHYGLTSSDLVEYDLHEAIAEHASAMLRSTFELEKRLARMTNDHRSLPRAGRTHGQTAEATTLGHQFWVFSETLGRIGEDLSLVGVRGFHPRKSPGPTGVSNRETPWPTVPSTQILPRDFLLRWASAYLNLSNTLETMAMFVRTGSRSEIAEFQEGAAAGRQGSSAMPGKRNPIQSEKVCGLARIARGHFLAIAEVSALWEDRDLSNSSTERIAVPGLAATVEHMLNTIKQVFEDLVIDEPRIWENARDPRCKANALQMEIQRTARVGPLEASRLATERMNA